MTHKSGFVNIIGNPNVGKSTLMNALVGEQLSIITSKAQTTRHRILGIVNGEDFQIVYSDTPGILKPNYQLQEAMIRFVRTALVDADIILYVTDVVETADKNEIYLDKIAKTNRRVFLIINKIDKADKEKIAGLSAQWKEILPNATQFHVSALKKQNLETLFNSILEALPEGPEYYPKDQLTDKPGRFFISEIIREKILMNYQKEIPYSVEIEIEQYKEEENIDRIMAVIHVARQSQKGIIIGHQGKMLKKVGTEARIDMEAFLQKKVFLELYVKVKKDWRDNQNQLRNFGYITK